MIPQTISAILLAIPLVVITVVSVPFWIEYKNSSKRGMEKQEIPYNKLFLALVGLGFFCIWPFWIGGMALLFLNKYYTFFRLATFSPSIVFTFAGPWFFSFIRRCSTVELGALFCRQLLAPLNSGCIRGAQTDSNGAAGTCEASILRVLRLDSGWVESGTVDMVAVDSRSMYFDWRVSDDKERRENVNRAVWRGIHRIPT